MGQKTYLEEALELFPEAETNYEALDLLESKTSKEIFELTQKITASIADSEKQLRVLTQKYLSVRVLKKATPILKTKLA
jgi:hypothetical protein